MALTMNGRRHFLSPAIFLGYSGSVGNFIKGGLRNRFAGGFDLTFGGYANGHLAPSSFILPQKSGSMSSYTEEMLTLVPVVADLTPAMPMFVSDVITLSADSLTLDRIVQMVADGAVVLLVDQAFISSAVALEGSATIDLSSFVQLGGIFDVVADAMANLAPNVSLSAMSFMIATGGGENPLSPEALADAVWKRAIETGYQADEIMRVLAAVAAGKTDIVPGSGGSATVIFRDLSDSKNRVTATMTGSERTTITVDKS